MGAVTFYDKQNEFLTCYGTELANFMPFYIVIMKGSVTFYHSRNRGLLTFYNDNHTNFATIPTPLHAD